MWYKRKKDSNPKRYPDDNNATWSHRFAHKISNLVQDHLIKVYFSDQTLSLRTYKYQIYHLLVFTRTKSIIIVYSTVSKLLSLCTHPYQIYHHYVLTSNNIMCAYPYQIYHHCTHMHQNYLHYILTHTKIWHHYVLTRIKSIPLLGNSMYQIYHRCVFTRIKYTIIVVLHVLNLPSLKFHVSIPNVPTLCSYQYQFSSLFSHPYQLSPLCTYPYQIWYHCVLIRTKSDIIVYLPLPKIPLLSYYLYQICHQCALIRSKSTIAVY